MKTPSESIDPKKFIFVEKIANNYVNNNSYNNNPNKNLNILNNFKENKYANHNNELNSDYLKTRR